MSYRYKILLEDTLKIEQYLNNIHQIKIKYCYYENIGGYNPSSISLIKMNGCHVYANAKSNFSSFGNLFAVFKKAGVKKLLVDIRDFSPSLIYNHLISKEIYDKALVFRKEYTSTNSSRMSLVMIDFSKIKLNEIKTT